MGGFGAIRKGGKGERSGPYSGGKGKGKGEDDETRMVYVANLPYSAEWQELKDFFATAGEVEFAKVLSKDGSTQRTKGKSRGIGYVRFATPEEAQAAIDTLNGAEMDGREIQVDNWTKPDEDSRPASKGPKIYSTKGKGKSQSLAVYTPPSRSASVGKGRGKGKGKAPSGEEDDQMIYVANLPFSAEWQELKDHFSQCGTVEYARILTKDGSTVRTKGNSRGVGYVRFSTPEEAQAAVDTLNGSEMDGREIVVDAWTTNTSSTGGGKKGGKRG
mmetsp:Transcript_36275/g.81955  ORF Transcript_36275/g.81955 Transcript_36275/m.81955 type:complete len:273 (+) Transcript_36275:97-915(+)